MNCKFSLLGALTLLPALSYGQANLDFGDFKEFRQTGPEELEFIGGSLRMRLRDGEYTTLSCIHPSPIPLPRGLTTCPSGTNALITFGDLDEDGVRDEGTYWAIESIVPYANVQPGRKDEIHLSAAPISGLPRILGGSEWLDEAVTIWFNLQQLPIRRFELTRYNYDRPYGPADLDRMYDEVKPGSYIWNFPRNPVGLTPQEQLFPFPIAINHLQMFEPVPGRGLLTTNNEFRLIQDDRWNDEGIFEIDPRLGFTFFWQGINGFTIIPGDQGFFSMFVRGTDQQVYPPPGIQEEVGPELIDLPTNRYDLGTFFFDIGDQVTAAFDVRRNSPSTSLSDDTSQRIFYWDVNYVDTYSGFIQDPLSLPFPPGTTDEYKTPDFDFDGDGYTNLEEYALLTDLADPADHPVILPQLDPDTGQCVVEFAKRPSTNTSIRYRLEYTTDLVNYQTIEVGDPLWFVELDDENTYKVRTRFAAPPATCIVRLKIEQLR